MGRKVFRIEDGLIGLFKCLKYKMVKLLDILKLLFLLPVNIFSVPEVEMTFTVSDAEQTRTKIVFILILLKIGMK